MATTPQPIGGGSGEGWTPKQIGKEIPLTDSARDVLELAQQFAAQAGAATVEPVHVLSALVFLPRNSARRALEAMGADLQRLESLRVAGGNAPSASWKTTPIGTSMNDPSEITGCFGSVKIRLNDCTAVDERV